ncbi:hypothetical protein MJO28_017697 [Puccinia striiformis f. sp. tritici]|uniref:Uncharacterized protein n=1 Tax=Puccinia striiformis TaxID=27350 RepID=A0A2S4URT1_9BASI|nr:hypothetical protein MJO28_017697 [Puccinia striiformis f. sp. tritici]POV99824.1 hypothetical protein PSTT_13538 [Puccinia striiformis]
MFSFDKTARKVSIRDILRRFRIFAKQQTHLTDHGVKINSTVLKQDYQSSETPRVDVCGAQVTNTNAEPPTDKQHICSQEIAQLETVKETVPKSSAIAANPPNSSSAPINCFDLYYPGLKDRTHSFLKGLSAPNRALMASATIETNKFYQEHDKAFRDFETQLIRDLFVSETSLFLTTDEFTERIEEVMSKNKIYQEMRSTVLQLRIRRHYYDGIIKSLEYPITPSSLSRQAIEGVHS